MIAHTLTDVLLWGALAGYVVLIGVLIVNVLGENRSPLSALAWVLALVFVPVVGAVFYFVFGRSLRNVRMISRRSRRRLMNSMPRRPLPRLSKTFSPENCRRVRLCYAVADAQLYEGNDIEIFNSGAPLFERMFADLEDAREYINLQFYIILGDEVGRRLCDVLCRKARQGVKVRVIYDYIGSFGGRSGELFKAMRDAGVETHAFFRIRFPNKLSRLNWRNHRKVVVIDGRVGYIGGFNIARRYLDGGDDFAEWRDLMVRVSGPAVDGLQSNFAIDWRFMGQPLLTDPVMSEPVGDVSAQILPSGPTNRWPASFYLYFKAVAGAGRRVWIQTPYFLPGDELLKAILGAALTGVDVRVMIPERSDSSVLTYATNSYIEECLLAGVKVYRYGAGMLHSKLMIVDDDFATLGSTNVDYRSFDHNFEENIVMYSREVTARLADLFLADQHQSRGIRLAEWNRRPRSARIRESLARLLAPAL